jgi:hypothetical protein
MSVPPALLALGVIFFFAAILFLMIQGSRRMRAEKTHQTQALGFELVETLPADLANRVEDVFLKRDQSAIYLENIYTRSELDRELFIFDYGDHEGDDSELGSEVFGVISSELALPKFSISTLPGFNPESLLGELMEKLLDKVLAVAEKYLGMQRVELPDWPEFDNQLVVFGQDHDAVQNLLRRVGPSILLQSKLIMHIAGSDDFLSVDFNNTSDLGGSENDLISQYQFFTDLYRAFMN